jgi:cyclic pyranopterin phosphate synthase
MIVDIYTDGSCLNNPGPGGWAAIVILEDGPRRLSGGEPQTTNNRMELMAAIKGLEAVSADTAVTVHSDSQYLVNTMTKSWKRNVNQDLWEQLDRLSAGREIAWSWVRGHAGHPLNEEADRLAGTAMNEVAGGGSTARLSHLDVRGKAHMVDVGAKPDTERFAIAGGVVNMQPETLALALDGRMEKGDVFTVARLAGIAAAKRTWELIPLAHQVPLSHVAVEFEPDAVQGQVRISATARTTAKTGVEMEALLAVAVSALAIYDMCKAVDKGIAIRDIHLREKHGGKSGDYVAPQ